MMPASIDPVREALESSECRCGQRAWLGTARRHPWRAGGCGGTLRKAAASQKLEPRPLIPSSCPPPTLLQAVEGQCELAHKIIGGGGVIVLHHKPHQHQLWDPELELQSLLPAGVEA